MGKWGFIMALPVAFITVAILYSTGAVQKPDDVAYKVNKDSNKPNEEYKAGMIFMSSESPNKINTLDLQEGVYVVKEQRRFEAEEHERVVNSTVRVYYGKRGAFLTKYAEFEPHGMYNLENFKIQWKNDNEATVEEVRKDDKGKWQVVNTARIDLTK